MPGISHFPKNSDNLKQAILIIYNKTNENEDQIEKKKIQILLGLKENDTREEKFMAEVIIFNNTNGTLTFTKLKEEGRLKLYRKIQHRFRKNDSNKTVCELCLEYLKQNGFI
ncbi:hypothetical protein KO317_03040 [Candidatus Micrarchaeota archaeon]|nr:hypothetical protein [Candidatus Micrarchaeota archaeon]